VGLQSNTERFSKEMSRSPKSARRNRSEAPKSPYKRADPEATGDKELGKWMES